MHNDEISIREILGIIRKNIFWVILSWVSIFAIFLLVAIFSPKQYKTTMKIMVGYATESRDLIMGSFPWYWNPTIVNNEVEIIRSSRLSQRVSLEMEPELREKLFPGFNPEDESHRQYLTSIIKSMIVPEPIDETDIIKITVYSTDPDLAYQVALIFEKVYLEDNLTQKKSNIMQVRKFLSNQVQDFKSRLHEAELAMQRYKTLENAAYLGSESVARIEKLTNFEAKYYEAKTGYAIKRTNLELLESRLDSQKLEAFNKISSISSPMITELKTRIVELKVQKSNLELQGYGYDHPKISSLQRQISENQAMLSDSLAEVASGSYGVDPVTIYQRDLENYLTLQIEVEVEKKKMEEFKKVVDHYNEALRDLPENQMEILRLSREMEVNEKIYLMLKEKFEEARIKEAEELGDLRVIDPPRYPINPYKPRRRFLAFVGMILGGFFGLGVGFIKEYLDFRIKSPTDFERIPDIKLLGILPKTRGKLRSRDLAEFEKNISQSELVNNFAIIRKSLQIMKPESEFKKLLITSTISGAGKSTCTVNLGISFAKSGKKVLVIDCDFRKPVLHQFFNVENTQGMTDSILDDTPVQSLIINSEEYGLDLITSGLSTIHPIELLESEKFRNIIEELIGIYDIVIFDSPPILMVPDAAIISSVADCVVFVEGAGETTREALLKANSILDDLDVCLSGVILNKVTMSGQGYYKYGKYY